MKRKTKVHIYNIVVLLLIAGGVFWVVSRFVHLGRVEFTDNASVHQHITPVCSRVQGFVREVRFSEYSPVRKGDTLVIIEDAEFRLRVAQAEAALENALAARRVSAASVETVQSNVGVSDAAIAECRAQMDNARREDERYSRLLERDAVTRQQYDRVHTAYLAAQARFEQMSRARRSAALARDEQAQRVEQGGAGVDVARAELNLARLNLSYTVVVAPCDGVLGRKTVMPGQLIQAGQQVVDIVDSSGKWIVANYRETQLRNIREGAAVSITVDAMPDGRITGRVSSISDATGSAVSVLPADNATGNFVKVEQRVPVRIDIDDKSTEIFRRLRAGMSVECEVKY